MDLFHRRKSRCAKPAVVKNLLATAFNKAPFKPTVVEDEIDEEMIVREDLSEKTTEEDDKNWAEVFGMEYSQPSTSADGSSCNDVASAFTSRQTSESSCTGPKIMDSTVPKEFRVEIGSDEDSEFCPSPSPMSSRPVLEAENITEEDGIGVIDLSQAISPVSSANDWTPTDTPEPSESRVKTAVPASPAFPQAEYVATEPRRDQCPSETDSDAEPSSSVGSVQGCQREEPTTVFEQLREAAAAAHKQRIGAFNRHSENTCQPSTSRLSKEELKFASNSLTDRVLSTCRTTTKEILVEKKMRWAKTKLDSPSLSPSQTWRPKRGQAKTSNDKSSDLNFTNAMCAPETIKQRNKSGGRLMAAAKKSAKKQVDSIRKTATMMSKAAPIQPSPNIMSSVKKKMNQQPQDRPSTSQKRQSKDKLPMESNDKPRKTVKHYKRAKKDPTKGKAIQSQLKLTKKIRIVAKPLEKLPLLSSDSDSDDLEDTEEEKMRRAAVLARFSKLFPSKHSTPSLVAQDVPFKFSPRKHWVDITSDGTGNFDHFVLSSATWKESSPSSDNSEANQTSSKASQQKSSQKELKKVVVSTPRMNYKDILKAKEQLKLDKLKASQTEGSRRSESQQTQSKMGVDLAEFSLGSGRPNVSPPSFKTVRLEAVAKKASKLKVKKDTVKKSKSTKLNEQLPDRKRKKQKTQSSVQLIPPKLNTEMPTTSELKTTKTEMAISPQLTGLQVLLSDVSDAECDIVDAETEGFYAVPDSSYAESIDESPVETNQETIQKDEGRPEIVDESTNFVDMNKRVLEVDSSYNESFKDMAGLTSSYQQELEDISDGEVQDELPSKTNVMMSETGHQPDLSRVSDEENRNLNERMGTPVEDELNEIVSPSEEEKNPITEDMEETTNETEFENDFGEVIDEVEEEEINEAQMDEEIKSSLFDVDSDPVQDELIWEYEVESEDNLKDGPAETSNPIGMYELDDISTADENSEGQRENLQDDADEIWSSPQSPEENAEVSKEINLDYLKELVERNNRVKIQRHRRLQWNWKRLSLRYASVDRRRVVENLIEHSRRNRYQSPIQRDQLAHDFTEVENLMAELVAITIEEVDINNQADSDLHEALARLRSLDKWSDSVCLTTREESFTSVSSLDFPKQMKIPPIDEVSHMSKTLTVSTSGSKGVHGQSEISDISDVSDVDETEVPLSEQIISSSQMEDNSYELVTSPISETHDEEIQSPKLQLSFEDAKNTECEGPSERDTHTENMEECEGPESPSVGDRSEEVDDEHENSSRSSASHSDSHNCDWRVEQHRVSEAKNIGEKMGECEGPESLYDSEKETISGVQHQPPHRSSCISSTAQTNVQKIGNDEQQQQLHGEISRSISSRISNGDDSSEENSDGENEKIASPANVQQPVSDSELEIFNEDEHERIEESNVHWTEILDEMPYCSLASVASNEITTTVNDGDCSSSRPISVASEHLDSMLVPDDINYNKLLSVAVSEQGSAPKIPEPEKQNEIEEKIRSHIHESEEEFTRQDGHLSMNFNDFVSNEGEVSTTTQIDSEQPNSSSYEEKTLDQIGQLTDKQTCEAVCSITEIRKARIESFDSDYDRHEVRETESTCDSSNEPTMTDTCADDTTFDSDLLSTGGDSLPVSVASEQTYNYSTPDHLVIQSTSNTCDQSAVINQTDRDMPAESVHENFQPGALANSTRERASQSQQASTSTSAPIEQLTAPGLQCSSNFGKDLSHPTATRMSSLDDDSFVRQLESGTFFPDLFSNEPSVKSSSSTSSSCATQDPFWNNSGTIPDPLIFVSEADLFGFNCFPAAVEDIPADLAYLSSGSVGPSSVSAGSNAPSLFPVPNSSPVTIEELAPMVNCEDNYFSLICADTLQRQINASGIADSQSSMSDNSCIPVANDILQQAVNMEIRDSSAAPKIPRFNVVKGQSNYTPPKHKQSGSHDDYVPAYTAGFPTRTPDPSECITIGGRIYQPLDTTSYQDKIAKPKEMWNGSHSQSFSQPVIREETSRMTLRVKTSTQMATPVYFPVSSSRGRRPNPDVHRTISRMYTGRGRGGYALASGIDRDFTRNSISVKSRIAGTVGGCFSQNSMYSGAGTSGYANHEISHRELGTKRRCWTPLALPPSASVVANDFGQEVELEALYAEHPHLYSSFRYSSTTDVIGESSTGTVRSCGAQYLDLWRQRIMDEPEVYHSYRGRRRGGTPRGPRGRPPLRNRGGGRAPYLSPSSSAPRRSQVDEWLLENIKSIMRKNSSLLSVSKDIERRGMSYGKRAVGAGVSEGFDSEDEDMDDPESEPAGRASTISASSSASIRTQDELAIFLDDEVDEEQIFSRRRKYTAIKEERATSSQDPSASTSVRSIGTEKPLSMLPKSRSFDTDTPRLRRSQPRKQSSLDDDDQSGVMVSSTTSPKTYGGITSVSGSPPFVPAKRPRGRPRKYPLKPEAKPQTRNQLKLSNESQLDGPSPNNTFGFNISDINFQQQKALHEIHHVWMMSVELHVNTREDLRPDPEFDAVSAILYSVHTDANPDEMSTGVIIVANGTDSGGQSSSIRLNDFVITGLDKTKCAIVPSESNLFEELVTVVRRYDPDILVGYEIQMLSWGYLIERAATLNIHLCSQISRVPDESKQSSFDGEDDWWSMVDLHVAGRIVLNVWRIMRHEVTLSFYSFESVAFHIMRVRTPSYTFRTLTDWFNHSHTRSKVIEYYKFRVEGNLKIILKNDLISRTSELAKLFGIQFYEVLSRGSQFRVESMLLRMTREKGFAAASPSIAQRGSMAAPECFALTLEPESKFYTDPVLVLDFQSLYPSVIIAYNYCYSTCLGKVEQLGSLPAKLGCLPFDLERDIVNKIKKDINISPAGVAFVKSSVRKGILPQMLEEILNTRLMVKKTMKKYKNQKELLKVLDARQLGLKLIANVTYGYTSANFSGRMPCVEIADSIVHKGRETLERAIKLVNDNVEWNARVVYGDTDSMFVVLPGRTKDEAFKIGDAIADEVTKRNPKPVKLKFEKVYYPCVLQTKKRYVGYSYETADQEMPKFDAKGIETVRRDTCAAVSKILQKSLCCLFETKDVDVVRQYVCFQFQKICLGRVNLRDFIFAKEYRGKASYKAGASVPALHIAKRRAMKDRRSEPRIGERVAYVITHTSPGDTLLHGVREPQEVLDDSSLSVNSAYYINNQICAALNRYLSLMGFDAKIWFAEMPKACRKSIRDIHKRNKPFGDKQTTLSQFFQSGNCLVCRQLTTQTVCVECRKDPQKSVALLKDRTRRLERKWDKFHKICQLCCSVCSLEIACRSLDCPVFIKRVECDRDVNNLETTRVAIIELDDEF